MKDDRPHQSITTTNQTGDNIIAGRDVNLGPKARVITPERRAKLIELLKNHSPGQVTVITESGASDAEAFGESFIEVLEAVGIFLRKRGQTGSISGVGGKYPTGGLNVGGPDPLRCEIVEALQAVGLPAEPFDGNLPVPFSIWGPNSGVVIQIRKTPTP